MPGIMECLSDVAAVDLFSGAGGLALGLQAAGVEVRLGSDFWKPAANSYRANFPDHPFLEVDARDLGSAEVGPKIPASTPWVMAGGPPCQGFSSAGNRRSDDPRNTLVGVYAELAAQLLPDVVVFENVEGFLTAEGGRFVQALLDPLIEAGYRVSLRKLNVANFGVPQLRKRVVGIAALHRDPIDLDFTHRAFGAPGTSLVAHGLPQTLTLADALAGLPAPSDSRPGEPSWHWKKPAKGLELERISNLKPGQTMRDLPEHLWHESYRRRANRRVSDGTPTERRGGAPSGIRRLVADEPSKAITGAASREFIHPTEDRSLTLRECARLQTFPDGFQFVGNANDVATMIGNAIPPRFAHALAEAGRRTALQTRDAGLPGALIRFEPTPSGGMSPALAKVTEMVRTRYPSGDGEVLPVESEQLEMQWA
jgi:DNA (cytosine-5)-methyltransferase 1